MYDGGQGNQVHSLSLADVIRACFYGVGAVYRREVFELVGGYRLGVFGEDYDFWLRAMVLGARHLYVPEPLSLFRVSATQKSARLEAWYRSDIRLVSDLRNDYQLSSIDRAAVEECIRERERLIAELHRPKEFIRDVLRPIPKRAVIAALGRQRARRLKRAAMALIGRPVAD
jgi:GT2 family glycosyltransferase